MCAHCALTGSTETHVDGTLLDKDLKPLFQGSEDEILHWIAAHPLIVDSVWIAGEGEPISIDEWFKWIGETNGRY